MRAVGFRLLLLTALAPAAHADWITRTEAIMGTRCAVELWSDDAAKGDAAITLVFDDMRRIDHLMSTWKEDTEISLVNRDAGKHPVKISEELFRLLQTSVKYSELTRGAFDITYASVGYLYDFKRHIHPDQAAIAAALPGINFRHMVLDPKKFTVYFMRPGMRIDLGGIAKGYACDQGVAILKRFGVTNAMVMAGGDTRLLGDRRGRPWMVGIRHPDNKNRIVLSMPLADVGISTSGDYERFFDEGGIRYHHIIDPKTGHSPTGVRSVTIIGPTATDTEGWSKGVFIKGPVEGIRLIEQYPEMDAVVVDKDGKVWYSKGLEPPR
jgi:FAD:protein FMN transferase